MDLFISGYDIFKDENSKKRAMQIEAIAYKRTKAVENRIKVAKAAIENHDMKTFCEVMHVDTKLFSKELEKLPEDERKCAEIMCKQSAEALEERLHELYLSQDKTTYLVCFNNGFAYSHISALDLHNYLKLKIRYKQICDNREAYLEDLRKEQFSRAIINPDEIAKAAKLHFLETEPYINEIVKAMQLYPFPNADIEKIIDETTNQVVKI